MNELRGRLLDLWDEIDRLYPRHVGRPDCSRWDLRKLRYEIWYAEWRLRVLAEGVKAGWLPPDVEHVSDLPEGWAA